MEELFRVGVISNTHGIRGEVKVYPTTDNVRRFDDLKEVILDTGKEQLNLHVTSMPGLMGGKGKKKRGGFKMPFGF